MPGSATAGASAVGDTATTGTATTVALSDHRHSREAFGTPVVVNGQTTALATGSLTTLARADHVHTLSNVPVLLASTTLGTATVSYTFSSLPTSYTHLRLVGQARCTYAGVQVNFGLQFNGDTGSNYWHNNDPSSAKTQLIVAILEGETNFFTTSFGSFDVVITRYQSATYKSARGSFLFNSSTTAGNPVEAGYAGYWINTAAITSVTCAFASGLSMKAGSQLSLYGIP
jgi:hypothetical protein